MAARTHFGKSAAVLAAPEASRLAAVLPNPRKFNPTGSSRYVVARAERIYAIMVRRGIVIPEYEDVMKDQSVLGALPENQDAEAVKEPEQQAGEWKKAPDSAFRRTEPSPPGDADEQSDRD